MLARLATVIAGALAGCLAGASVLAAPEEVTGTLKKVLDSGVITIGYRESSFPFSYLLSGSQQPVGYSIDLCHEIVDEVSTELGRQIAVHYKPVTPESRIPALTQGEIDLECGSTTNNAARQEQVAFSPIFFITGTKLLVKRSSGIRSYRDLRNRTVAVTAGTTNEAALKALSDKQKLGIAFVVGKDHAESFGLVAAGKADAFATDDVLLYGLLAKGNTAAEYEVVGDFLSYDPYGLMYRKDDPDFAAVVEETFRSLAESRELAWLYQKWFMKRLPGGERLNLEMSPQLTEIFHVLGMPD